MVIFREITFYSDRYKPLFHEISKAFPNVRNPDSDFLSGLVLQRLLGRILSADRLDASRPIFREQCVSKHSSHRFNIGRGVGFFIGLRREERREKKAKYLLHYHKLEENVFEKWLDLSAKTVSYTKDYPTPAMNSFYLVTSSSFESTDKWHKWAVQHIYDEKGYPNIKNLLEKLKEHEKVHNNFVLSLLKTINKEINEVLTTFPNIKKHENGTTNDFYYMENTLYALHNPDKSPKIYGDELLTEDGAIIAKTDGETLQKLEDELERIKSIHKEDFVKIEDCIEQDKKILNEIRSLVEGIIYELSLDKPLKGKCDYEHSLDK